MRIINTKTFEQIEFDLLSIRTLVKKRVSKYYPENETIDFIDIPEDLKDLLLLKIKATYGDDWVLIENFNDWLAVDTEEKKYVIRVIANQKQRDTISDEHPEFLMMLNEGIRNPKFEVRDMWEIYITSFAEGVEDYLRSINVKIEYKPGYEPII